MGRYLLAVVATIVSALALSGCGPSNQSKQQQATLAHDKELAQAQKAYKAGDLNAAIRIWRDLAKQGDATAQFNIGLMYANGTGVAQSDTDAVKWYRKAADQGLAQAQSKLAAMYMAGKGVPQDYAGAISLVRKSADQGYAEAQFNLGIRYAEGLGVPQDYIQAHKWCNLGAAGASDPEVQIAAVDCRNGVAAKMPAAKIMEAQRLASAWRPVKGSKSSVFVVAAIKPEVLPKPKPSATTPALPEVVSEEEYQASLQPKPRELREYSWQEYQESLRPMRPKEMTREEYEKLNGPIAEAQ
jgi:hypothetical protein